MNTGQSVIKTDIPFIEIVNQLLFLQDISPAEATKQITQLKLIPPFLRWEAVRKLPQPTGFEGFFVGDNLTNTQIALEIANIGAKYLANLKLNHPHGYLQRRNQILRLLTEYKFNHEALLEINAIFGAILGTLRCKLHDNKVASQFRSETDRVIATARFNLITTPKEIIGHEYTIPNGRTIILPPANEAPLFSSDELIEGYRFMQKIGLIGHPALRWYIHHH